MKTTIKQRLLSVKYCIKSWSASKIFSVSLFACCFCVMTFFAVVRFCGLLWYSSDSVFENVQLPSKLWQSLIIDALLAFELSFVYKVLIDNIKWVFSILIAIVQTAIGHFIPISWCNNLFHMLMMFVIPVLFNRTWKSLIATAVLYAIELLYSCIFLLAKTGTINVESGRDFCLSVISTIDFKLLIVSIYLIKCSIGGKFYGKRR